MQVIVDNRIRLETSGMPREAVKAIKDEFRHNNPEYFRKRAIGIYTGNIQRTIGTYKLEEGGKLLTLPRGGLKRFRQILLEYDLEPEIIDNRFKGGQVDFSFDPSFKPRPYQIEAINAILAHETCLIQGGAGSGKTEIILSAIVAAGLRALVVVPIKRIFTQWVQRIEQRLHIPKKQIGVIGGGKFKLGDGITVGMKESVRNKLPKLRGLFGFVGLDECHHASAKTFIEVIDFFDAYYRVGGTATIKRQDLKHFLTHDLFGEIAFKITRDELEDLGFLTEVTLHVVNTSLEFDYLNETALQDAYADQFEDYEDLNAKERRKAARELELEAKDYPQYLDAISGDKDRNNLIYQWVRYEYDRGSKIVIFTKRRAQCELWKNNLARIGLECVIFWATNTVREEKRIERDLKRIKKGEVRIAIGTVIDEGIDMPAVDCGFITYRNAKNPGQLEQQAGRLARLFEGKDESRLYYFHDAQIERFEGDIKALQRSFKKVVIHDKPPKWKKLR